ncbi:MAG: aspartate ammonia-lyase [Acidobacteriota bacterium]
MTYRTERDPLGEFRVPAEAYYGVQTARALENFRISGLTAPPALVRATILIKRAAAEANRRLGRLPARIADAIIAAADEILAGKLRDQFVVDVYQAGAGTSHNMNANEVLANRAAELLGKPRGTYTLVHPNDHVNMGQSTNDVFPTATRLAVLMEHAAFAAECRALAAALASKAATWTDVLKVGRTHLQDAVPVTLGQEFEGYAACLVAAVDASDGAAAALGELNLGATAVGTGLNAGHDYTVLAVGALARSTGLAVRPADNRFRVTQSMGDLVAYSGALRRLAVELSKISSDLRLLSMGPRAGLAEIRLPAVQPGSSIMPGKVNPSIPEMVNQVCYQVYGCDTTIMTAGEAGQLELNVMMPVMAWNALHAQGILTRAMKALRERTVDGMTACRERARALLDQSTAVATALSPYLGYAATAEIAKHAVESGRTIREIVLERRLMPAADLDRVLSVEAMTRPGVPGRPTVRAHGARQPRPGKATAHAARVRAVRGRRRR